MDILNLNERYLELRRRELNQKHYRRIQNFRRPRKFNLWILIPAVTLGILFTFGFFLGIAKPDIHCPDNLWRGHIAEAVSEGPDGMYAVACVVRNRLNAGMNSGLVALRRRDGAPWLALA